jgi:hypothetical protein
MVSGAYISLYAKYSYHEQSPHILPARHHSFLFAFIKYFTKSSAVVVFPENVHRGYHEPSPLGYASGYGSDHSHPSGIEIKNISKVIYAPIVCIYDFPQ